jgi:hypothetical protein
MIRKSKNGGSPIFNIEESANKWSPLDKMSSTPNKRSNYVRRFKNDDVLLCISDLEGCVEKSNNGVNQSNELCKHMTFEKINYLLNENSKLKVCFLGDYFDNGKYIAESISGIVSLYENFKDRVTIILGNRDINKMRIPIEIIVPSDPNINTWSVWKIDFNKLPDNPLERTKLLLEKTYGAPNLLTNLATEFTASSDPEFKQIETTEQEVLDSFLNIFGKNSKSRNVLQRFEKDCRSLFTYGKLIDVIDIGQTKVLVSHAGTYNANIFKIQNTSIDPLALAISSDHSIHYFNKIEKMRKLLISEKSNEVFLFDESITYYNGLLEELMNGVNKLIEDENSKKQFYELLEGDTNTLRKNYLLLQAMGLKGDSNDPTNFLSPIASCGLEGGCDKPIYEPSADFVDILKANKIKIVAHGHIPFCGTVPLIHQEKDIGFLSCDTSNGNRPDMCNGEKMKLENIPLGYIIGANSEKTKYSIGITSINGDENYIYKELIGETDVSLPNENDSPFLSSQHTIGCSNDGKDTDMFKIMIDEFEEGSLPTIHESRKKIIYPGDKAFVISDTQFGPATIQEIQIDESAHKTGLIGGKKTLKNKKNKKTKRKNKDKKNKGKNTKARK